MADHESIQRLSEATVAQLCALLKANPPERRSTIAGVLSRFAREPGNAELADELSLLFQLLPLADGNTMSPPMRPARIDATPSAIVIPFPAVARVASVLATASGAWMHRASEAPAVPGPCVYDRGLWWGELLYGGKAQIQAFGIAKDRAFPGEVGGPRRTLRVEDPRGFDTEIRIDWAFLDGERRACGFVVKIKYPGRDLIAPGWKDAYPGVRMREGCWWFDEFVGTAEALVGAGLLTEGQFPGQPGMRRVRVSIAPDGAVIDGRPNAADARRHMPGSKVIEKAGASMYRAQVQLSNELANERNEREDAMRACEIAFFKRKLRPPALVCGSHLRLV